MQARGRADWRLAACILVSLLPTACQTGRGGPAPRPTPPASAPIPTVELPTPTLVPTAEATGTPRAVSRPPGVSLVAESGEQQGELGAYCWQGRCVQTIGRIIPVDPLRIVQREEALIVFGNPPPATFQLLVFPAGRGRAVDLPQPNSIAWQDQGIPPVLETSLGLPATQPVPTASPGSTRLLSKDAGQDAASARLKRAEVLYRFDLAPGRYVFELRGEWQAARGAERSEASYGFSLEVTPTLVGSSVQVGRLHVDRARLIEYQGSVDVGHQPWRLDPLPVAMEAGRSLGLDPRRDTYALVSQRFDVQASTWRAIVGVDHAGQGYEMELIQPVKVGPEGIWAVVELRVASEGPSDTRQ